MEGGGVGRKAVGEGEEEGGGEGRIEEGEKRAWRF